MTAIDSTPITLNRTELTKIFSHVELSTTRFYKGIPCWEWTGRLHQGYARMRIQKHDHGIHRLLYQVFVEPVSKTLHCDHLCVNPKCINPAHIEPVLPVENMRRGGSPSGKNSIKTHCKYGHEFTPENIYWRKGGKNRECKICTKTAANKQQALKRAERPPKKRPSHCLHNHPFSGENLYIDKKGQYHCKACHCARETAKHRDLLNLPFDHPRRIQQRAWQQKAEENRRQKRTAKKNV